MLFPVSRLIMGWSLGGKMFVFFIHIPFNFCRFTDRIVPVRDYFIVQLFFVEPKNEMLHDERSRKERASV
jgi:hypothetical protein